MIQIPVNVIRFGLDWDKREIYLKKKVFLKMVARITISTKTYLLPLIMIDKYSKQN